MAIVINGSGTVSGLTEQASNVELTDSTKIMLGTGDDLQIYHDGNNSYVKDTGDGDLYLMGAAEVLIRSATNENMIKAVANAQVNLYYDNAVKLNTTATGVTVTGAIAGATNLGKVLQVVTANHGTQVVSSSTTFVDTGVTASITPSATSSKILVTVSQMGLDKRSNNTYMHLITLRGSTQIHTANGQELYNGNTNVNTGSCTWSYLDSPSSTSAVTYKTQFKSVSGSSQVSVQWSGATSTITLMEIAG